jgi:hypothetical protein
MRGNFSPLAAAARLHAARTATVRAAVPSAAPVHPPRPASNPPFTGIRQALLAIQQARHA